ncbi:JAB domain-containing protein [Rubellicoccus peritrichatus]|uniref:DNA repair protein RadC n=1 Tax=Rubellicoccus peritrichatus TaxID=3080537 RepID=A0AAQ3QV25_9BACT|nr:DNA repair protein RadC [Puniceicoccus sp. CR14]WOO41073.1 DNA repair protein RadC [Puniceicoccus sp. CR14]
MSPPKRQSSSKSSRAGEASAGFDAANANSGAGHRSRLRARFEKSKFLGFSEHEIVELLLTLCIPRTDVKQPAKALLAKYGSLRRILDAPADGLREVSGIGSVTPIALQIIREAATLYLQESAGENELFDSTEALINLFRIRLGALRHEVFEVAYLDKSYRLIHDGIERLEEGVADRTRVYPGKVMRAALQKNAVFIVVAHNHPTGRLKASPEDKRLTQSLVEAAQAIQLTLLDHVIVTPDSAMSFLDEGLL